MDKKVIYIKIFKCVEGTELNQRNDWLSDKIG